MDVERIKSESGKNRLAMKRYNNWKDDRNKFYAKPPTSVFFKSMWAMATKRVALDVSHCVSVHWNQTKSRSNWVPFEKRNVRIYSRWTIEGSTARGKRSVWIQRRATTLERCCLRCNQIDRTQPEQDRQHPVHGPKKLFPRLCMWMTRTSLVRVEQLKTWLTSRNYRSSVGERIDIVDRKIERRKAGYRLTHVKSFLEV